MDSRIKAKSPHRNENDIFNDGLFYDMVKKEGKRTIFNHCIKTKKKKNGTIVRGK